MQALENRQQVCGGPQLVFDGFGQVAHLCCSTKPFVLLHVIFCGCLCLDFISYCIYVCYVFNGCVGLFQGS